MNAISARWRKNTDCKRNKSKLAREKASARWKINKQNVAVDSIGVNKKHHIIQQSSSDVSKCTENQNSSPTISAKSRTEKKFQYFNTPTTSVNNGSNYAIVHSSMWKTLLQTLSCDNCGKNELSVNSTLELGYSAKLQLFCSSCQKVYANTFSSPRVSKSQRFEINQNIVEAFLNMGKGHSAMEAFSMALGIQTMDRKTFDKYVVQLVEDTEKELILNAARKTVREQHELLDTSLQGEEIIDIGVSFDGTWHKRGHSSLYCIGCIIDILTGLVIDFTVISKYCHQCTKTAADLGKESAEFFVWYKSHKDSSACEKNYEGSSGSMEAFAAEILWRRSVKNCNMRYTAMLSDGDSKTFINLSKQNIYSGINIIKEECINHVAKRLCTALKNKVKEYRIKGECLSGRKKGNLTEETIAKLGSYYRKAIKENAPDIPKMKTAIFASLYHTISTNKKPQHQKCPIGEESWCFYNRSLAKGLKPADHKIMKTVLSENVVSKILPVYQRLASDDILKKCTTGGTQNANESVHNSIWRMCPKDTFVSKRRLEFAALNGISQFNMGCVATLKIKDTAVTSSPSLQIAMKKDRRRLRQSVYRNTPEYKVAYIQKRFKMSQKKKKQEKKEGLSYGAGAF